MKCPYCGKEIKDDINFCPVCGNPLKPAGNAQPEYVSEESNDQDTICCPFCGGINLADAQFCIYCGKDMYDAEAEKGAFAQSVQESPYADVGSAGAGTATADASKRRRIILIVIIIAACAAAAFLIAFSFVRRNNMHNTSAAWVEESDNLAEQGTSDEDLDERELALDDITEVESPDAEDESSDTDVSDSSGADESTAGSSSGSKASASESEVADITFIRSYDNSYESAVITATDADGRVVWEYNTPGYPMTELNRTVEIGRNGDAYYIIQDTHLLALDVKTGDILWENVDSCGSPADNAFAFGEDAIYISGYYGPDFIAISYDGRTLKSIGTFDSDYYWPYRIELSGNEAYIYFEKGPVTEGGPWIFSVDLTTWNYSLGEGSSQASANSGFSMSDVTDVTASSFLYESEYGISHQPSNVIDGSLDNAWCESESGQGIGSWIELSFNGTYNINGININAGYQKSEDLYYKNSRPKDIRINFSDGSYMDYTLSDAMGQQTISFSSPVSTSSVTVTIMSVYEGSKYQDTLISEISIY